MRKFVPIVLTVALVFSEISPVFSEREENPNRKVALGPQGMFVEQFLRQDNLPDQWIARRNRIVENQKIILAAPSLRMFNFEFLNPTSPIPGSPDVAGTDPNVSGRPNGVLDLADLVKITIDFGNEGVSAEDPVDVSGDGVVDIVDLVLIARDYGSIVIEVDSNTTWTLRDGVVTKTVRSVGNRGEFQRNPIGTFTQDETALFILLNASGENGSVALRINKEDRTVAFVLAADSKEIPAAFNEAALALNQIVSSSDTGEVSLQDLQRLQSALDKVSPASREQILSQFAQVILDLDQGASSDEGFNELSAAVGEVALKQQISQLKREAGQLLIPADLVTPTEISRIQKLLSGQQGIDPEMASQVNGALKQLLPVFSGNKITVQSVKTIPDSNDIEIQVEIEVTEGEKTIKTPETWVLKKDGTIIDGDGNIVGAVERAAGTTIDSVTGVLTQALGVIVVAVQINHETNEPLSAVVAQPLTSTTEDGTEVFVSIEGLQQFLQVVDEIETKRANGQPITPEDQKRLQEAAENAGLMEEAITTIVNQVNRPPQVQDIKTAKVSQGETVTVNLNVSDPDGDSLAVTPQGGLPKGASLKDGVLTWENIPGGEQKITFLVTDGVFERRLTVTIPVNQPPTLTAEQSATVVDEGKSVTIQLQGSDLDQDSLIFRLLEGHGATGVSFDSTTGTLSWTPGDIANPANPSVTVTFQFQASDDGGKTWYSQNGIAVQVTVQDVAIVVTPPPNQPPSFNSPVSQTQEIAEGQTFSLTITATDPNNDDLTYTLQEVTGALFPVGIQVVDADGNNRRLQWTPNFVQTGVYKVKLSITDGKGGVLATEIKITVANTNRDPGFSGTISNQSAAEGSAITAINAGSLFTDADVVAGDGDGLVFSASGLPSGLSINASTGVISGTPGFTTQGELNITVTATDSHGKTVNSNTFKITVANTNRDPGFSGTISNQSAAEGSAITAISAGSLFTDADVTAGDGDGLTYSASGLPSGLSINASTGVISGTPGFTTQGELNITVTATDSHGKTVNSNTFKITVANTNRDPGFSGTISNQSAAEGSAITAINAGSLFTDADVVAGDGDGLVFSASGLPSGLSINASTGVISGTPGFNTQGEVNITVTATDSHGRAVASNTFKITVANTNRDPVFSGAISNASAAEGSAITAISTAGFFSDADVAAGDGDGLVFSASGLPSGLSINASTGVISGTPGFTTQGEVNITVTATDSHGRAVASNTFKITVANTNRDPGFSGTISNQSAAEGSAITAISAGSLFTDADVVAGDGDSLVFSASGLPSGLSINASTGVISGTPGYTTQGEVNITVTATDSHGKTVNSNTFKITVGNTNRDPLFSGTIADQSAAEGTAITAINAGSLFTDADVTAGDGDSLVFSASGLPSGLSINASTGVISGTPGFTTQGELNITVTATDSHGKTVNSNTFKITVANTNRAPTATAIPDQTAAEGSALSGSGFNISGFFSDPDGQALTFNPIGELPPGMNVSSSGLVTWTPGFAQEGIYTITVQATDQDSENPLTQEQTITIQVTHVNQAPIFGTPENPITSYTGSSVNIGAAPTSFNVPQARDLDEDVELIELIYSVVNQPSGVFSVLDINSATGNITLQASGDAAPGTYTITVQVSDGQGGIATLLVTIQVQ